ncbi:hypothetical protein BJX66DRAFT_161048 [Aspergillus keveii]|uniref:Uncharacterized protein n=1 Tax=Aspergillus keveii TaxID=714993 RepID=A0ABR4FHX3_9EURO
MNGMNSGEDFTDTSKHTYRHIPCYCKLGGRIDVDSQSVFTRRWFPSKQRDVRLRRMYERGRRSCMLIDSETNRWRSGRPAIPQGHIYTDGRDR